MGPNMRFIFIILVLVVCFSFYYFNQTSPRVASLQPPVSTFSNRSEPSNSMQSETVSSAPAVPATASPGCSAEFQSPNCWPSELELMSNLRGSERQKSLFSLLEKYPHNVEVLKQLGLLYRDEFTDLPEAKRYFRQSFEQNPDRLDVGDELRATFAASNQGEEGLEYFKNLESQHPQNPHVQLQLGASALEQGDSLLAIQSLQKARNEMPDLLQTYELLSQAYLDNREPKQARKTLEDLLEFHREQKVKVAALGFSTEGIEADIERVQERIDAVETKE